MPDVSSKHPLSATWREWIASRTPQKQAAKIPYDVVVVGSGYGGAVAALRLAEKGYRVLVLERGSEYLPGEFPNHFSQVPKYVRANVPGQGLPLGRATGLVEVSVGQGMVAVTGNGLGGGSLINAGVAMKPDDDVFAQDAWPASIRHNNSPIENVPSLDVAFSIAKNALGATAYQPPNTPPIKTQELAKATERAGLQGPRSVDLTIRPDRCIQCGDCASGCNVPEAKGDLRTTYLRKAVQTGRVQIVTLAEVYRFAPHIVDNAFKGWCLWVFATDAQHHKSSREEAGSLHDQEIDPASTLRQILVPQIVISAGTLGSTQLLQRSQSLAGESLAFSPALGTRLSGNGDALSVMVQAEERVNAVGHGSQPPGTHWSLQNPAHHPHIVGPTITAAVDERDRTKALNERVVLEDGAIPGAIARVFEELVASTLVAHQLDRWAFFDPLNKGHPHGGQETPLDPLAASTEIAARSQIWLSMGHDDSPGRILWLPGTDGAAMVMPDPRELKTYKVQQALFELLSKNGIHIHNPLWSALPEGTRATMSGTKPPPTITSVHPLGGCPMNDDPAKGVVNDLGQVWVHQPSNPARAWVGEQATPSHPESPKIYPGLFVLDGSIVPTSLGCNPLLTITALAERAMSAWSENPRRFPPSHIKQSSRRLLRQPRLPKTRWEVRLREELNSESNAFSGHWKHESPKVSRATLRVDFLSQDFDETLKLADHPLTVDKAALTLETAGAAIDYALPPNATKPEFHFLPAPPALAQGRCSLVLTLAELFALLSTALSALTSFFWLAAGLILRLIGNGASDWSLSGLGVFLLALLALAFEFLVLPTGRTLLTWLVLRGHDDIRHWLRKDPAAKSQPFVPRLISMLKQLVHSREKREMRYDMVLQRSGTDTQLPHRIRLKATKRVVYRASVLEVLKWFLHQFQRSSKNPPPIRRTFWEQVMDADATVRVAGGLWSTKPDLFKGRLRMGLDNLFRPSTAQLGRKGDTSTGLLLVSGYALLALRFAFKTHVFDFRLPTFSNKPLLDRSDPPDLVLKSPANPDRLGVYPTAHRIKVQRGWSSGDSGSESVAALTLPLWQYPQLDLRPSDQLTETAVRTVRVKVALLLHAFGQSGLAFTYANEDVPHSLAGHLYDQGFEVWVLDSRMSTRSGYAEQPCNVDMMGEHDVPGAVEHILIDLRRRLNVDASTQIQIAVAAQCIGSASAWMAALSGKLSQNGTSKLYALVSSQVHPIMQGSKLTRAKTWLPALLRHATGVVPFAVRGPQEQGALQLLDRVLSSLPVPAAERVLSDDEDAVATCRRIRFIEAPLFLHQNMASATIRDMPKLFGSANVRLFEHARRFVSHGSLVDEDGLSRYVTEENARQHITFPVMLLHGEKNELFDVQSAHASREWLRKSGALRPLSALMPIQDHGHLDVLLGRNAQKLVFQPVSQFLGAAHQAPPARDRQVHDQWRLVEPIHGPVLGWVRGSTAGSLLVRSSLVLDEGCPPTRYAPRPRFSALFNGVQCLPLPGAEFVVVVRTAATPPPGPCVQVSTYPVRRPRLGSSGNTDTPAYLAVRVDIDLNPSCKAAMKIEVLVFRRTASLDGLSTTQLTDHLALDAAINRATEGFAQRSQLVVSTSTQAAAMPGASSVSILASCCRYPGLSIDKERIDTALNAALKSCDPSPAMALLLGDQIYADATAGLVDPVSPIERYFERHLTAFNPESRQGMSLLQRTVPTLMTPDDHEWIDNYPSAAPLLKWPWPDWRRGTPFWQHQHAIHRWARSSIRVFQKIQGPDVAIPPLTKFLPATETLSLGPVRVFLLDTRYSRTRKRQRVISRQSLLALTQWLDTIPTDQLPLIACGSVLLPGIYDNADPANPGPVDSWQHAPNQRQALLEALMRWSRPFVLLSGDYHVSAVVEIQNDGKTIGLSVITQPMYAPLPYANAQAHHLNLAETLNLAGGNLSLVVPAGGAPYSGSGIVKLSFETTVGGFQVTVDRTLFSFGEPLPLGAGNAVTHSHRAVVQI